MTGPLPTDAQACQGEADTLAGNRHLVNFPEVVPQETIRPTGGAIAELARVLVDDGREQRLNDPAGGAGASGAGRISQPVGEVKVLALLKALGPVVDGATADAQQFSDPLGGFSGSEPEQGLAAAVLLGAGPLGQKVVQLLAFPSAELKVCHGLTFDAIPVVH